MVLMYRLVRKPGYDDPATGVKGEKGVDGTNGLTVSFTKTATASTKLRLWRTVYNSLVTTLGTVNKQKLNSLVKVQGEGVTEAESATDDSRSASGNIQLKLMALTNWNFNWRKTLKILIP